MFIFFLCIAYKNGTKVIVFRGLPLSCHEESIYSDIKARLFHLSLDKGT